MKLYTNLMHKLENSLIYIGCGFGIILLLDTAKRFLDTLDFGVLVIVGVAVLLWLTGILVQKFRYKKIFSWKKSAMVFLLAFAFVAIFQNALLTTHDGFLLYFTHTLFFVILVNLVFILGILLFIVIATEMFYTYIIRSRGISVASPKSAKIFHVFILSFLLVAVFTLLVNPYISRFLLATQNAVVLYLQGNFQGLVDVLFATPALYFLYVIFRGTEVSENTPFLQNKW